MSNDNSASWPKATPSIVVLFADNDISVTFMKHQLPDTASFKMHRYTTNDGVRMSFDLLLIDHGSLPETDCRDLLRKASDKPVALINVTHDVALNTLHTFPWVRGVFYKNTTGENFRSGIQTMLAGGDWLPRALMEKLIARYRTIAFANDQFSALTTREKQVLRLAGKGLSNVDIAERINLSIHTVKSHVHNALCKLGATNRAHAAAMVIRHFDETDA